MSDLPPGRRRDQTRRTTGNTSSNSPESSPRAQESASSGQRRNSLSQGRRGFSRLFGRNRDTTNQQNPTSHPTQDAAVPPPPHASGRPQGGRGTATAPRRSGQNPDTGRTVRPLSDASLVETKIAEALERIEANAIRGGSAAADKQAMAKDIMEKAFRASPARQSEAVREVGKLIAQDQLNRAYEIRAVQRNCLSILDELVRGDERVPGGGDAQEVVRLVKSISDRMSPGVGFLDDLILALGVTAWQVGVGN